MTPAVRWEVVHTSTFRYASPVHESQNELRACPTSDDAQALLHHRVVVEPGARVHAYDDYWGTRVETFGVRGPHERLRVTAESSVVVRPRPAPPVGGVPLAALDDPAVRDEHREVLTPTALTDGVELQPDEAADEQDVWSLASSLCRLVADRVALVERRTGAGRSAWRTWDDGRGDATDRSHVLLALLRARGVPARHVAGYVGGGDRGGALHAWVEVLLPGHGWFGLDPAGPVGRGHVVVGRARDHTDLTILRGAYLGAAEHVLDVDITLTEAPEVTGPGARMQQQQQQQ